MPPEQAGFDLLLTADKNIRYQQNLAERKIAIIVLSQLRWRLVSIRLTEIASAVNTINAVAFVEVEIPFD